MDLLPTNAQYCFGRCRPSHRVMNGLTRSPSPPAKTIDHTFLPTICWSVMIVPFSGARMTCAEILIAISLIRHEGVSPPSSVGRRLCGCSRDRVGMLRPQAVGHDRLIEPLATIHAAPRRRLRGLCYFQGQRIGEGRNHQSSTACAAVGLHRTGSLTHGVSFHDGLALSLDQNDLSTSVCLGLHDKV